MPCHGGTLTQPANAVSSAVFRLNFQSKIKPRHQGAKPMSHNDNHTTFNPVSKLCFSVAGLAFVGSFACAAINHALSGWMAVAGMAGLGLFYLAIGVLNLSAKMPISMFERENQPRRRPSDFKMSSYDNTNASDEDSTNPQDGTASHRSQSPQDDLIEV